MDRLAVVVFTDSNGLILEVKSEQNNPIFEVNTNILKCIHEHYQTNFFDALKEVNENGYCLGKEFLLANDILVLMSFLKVEEKISISILGNYGCATELLNEIIYVSNEQTNMIRNLYKKLSNAKDEEEYLNQIMKLNNDLINTKRFLSQKNKELNRLNLMLEDISNKDHLTKTGNRRKFFIDVKNFVSNKNIDLIIMDINHFKLINDELGHDVGDLCLKDFSDEISSLIKENNGNLYRIGGDEFAILIPSNSGYDIHSYIDHADRIIQSYHRMASISFGTISIEKNHFDNNSKVTDIMKVADKLMYENKKSKKSIFEQNI